MTFRALIATNVHTPAFEIIEAETEAEALKQINQNNPTAKLNGQVIWTEELINTAYGQDWLKTND